VLSGEEESPGVYIMYASSGTNLFRIRLSGLPPGGSFTSKHGQCVKPGSFIYSNNPIASWCDQVGALKFDYSPPKADGVDGPKADGVDGARQGVGANS
jgi:hypothetical protein